MKNLPLLAAAFAFVHFPTHGDDSRFSDLEKMVFYNTVRGVISETGSQDCLTHTGWMRKAAELSLQERKPHSCRRAETQVPDAIFCDNYDLMPYGVYDSEEREIYLYQVNRYQIHNGIIKGLTAHSSGKLFLYTLIAKLESGKGVLSVAVIDRKYLFRDARTPEPTDRQQGYFYALFPEYNYGYFFPPALDPKSEKFECEVRMDIDIKLQKGK